MFGRFTVRPSEDGGTYGVWDGAVNGWRATGLSRAQASRMATDLDIQYDARGPRDPSTVRRLSTPRPVQKAEWSAAGELDVWVVDAAGQWFGRICDEHDNYGWEPGSELRPQ